MVAWMVSELCCFVPQPRLGLLLAPLYRLTAASSAFGLDSSVSGPDHFVLVQTSDLTTRHIFEMINADLKGRAEERLGAPLEFQEDVSSNAFLSIPAFFPSYNHLLVSSV